MAATGPPANEATKLLLARLLEVPASVHFRVLPDPALHVRSALRASSLRHCDAAARPRVLCDAGPSPGACPPSRKPSLTLPYPSRPLLLLPAPATLQADYYSVIKRPVCLGDMSRQMNAARYTLADMQRDIRRMLANAKKYNRPEAVVYQDSLELERVTRKLVKEIERDGPEDEDEDCM